MYNKEKSRLSVVGFFLSDGITQMLLKLQEEFTAVQWNKHGDHHSVVRSCGTTWELFPDEDDENYGILLPGCILIQKGDWIVWSKTFNKYAIFKSKEAMLRVFSPVS